MSSGEANANSQKKITAGAEAQKMGGGAEKAVGPEMKSRDRLKCVTLAVPKANSKSDFRFFHLSEGKVDGKVRTLHSRHLLRRCRVSQKKREASRKKQKTHTHTRPCVQNEFCIAIRADAIYLHL